MLLNLAIQNDWYTRQIDFSNAFVQADIEEDVYLTLPAMFKNGNSMEVMPPTFETYANWNIDLVGHPLSSPAITLGELLRRLL